ncbi:lysophospholipid acyltransferase family protein [Denitromonas iodatirespirans]|uniref:Lysophospholipid acyltransferase family protein n=1 Tax=Denitromonas iodatirespirans TaxID=2795389 RepID=A0A944DB54_DENI1|nr:lysophospholipid acyltransferase family protein [Denitromonas iodatirespirans]MBT0961846.1 lysophospholipid acyltransferase family protein [Denitromonas iodatirespirans]
MFAQFLFRILAALPLSVVHRLGALIGVMAYALSPKYRARLCGNLTQAMGPPATRLRGAVMRESGKQALELPWVLLRPHAEVVAKVVKVSGWELVDAAHAEGAGILFLVPHLGCFEITAQYYASRDRITVLYRPPNFSALMPLIAAGRQRGGMSIAPAAMSGVRKLVKALRSGEAIGMLPDQTPDVGEGMWAPFFDRPAWTMTLAARLSEVKGVRVICCWAERLPGGRGYHVRFQAPTAPIEGDTAARVAAINREMEAMIRACPTQYLWGYHRYKRPSRVPLPEGEA